jgi:hypothetical protein
MQYGFSHINIMLENKNGRFPPARKGFTRITLHTKNVGAAALQTYSVPLHSGTDRWR